MHKFIRLGVVAFCWLAWPALGAAHAGLSKEAQQLLDKYLQWLETHAAEPIKGTCVTDGIEGEYYAFAWKGRRLVHTRFSSPVPFETTAFIALDKLFNYFADSQEVTVEDNSVLETIAKITRWDAHLYRDVWLRPEVGNITISQEDGAFEVIFDIGNVDSDYCVLFLNSDGGRIGSGYRFRGSVIQFEERKCEIAEEISTLVLPPEDQMESLSSITNTSTAARTRAMKRLFRTGWLPE